MFFQESYKKFHFCLIDVWFAGIAQLVEQLIRNQEVVGSTPLTGTSSDAVFNDITFLSNL